MRRIPRSKGADLAGGWQGKWQGSNSEKPVEAAGIIDCVKPTRTEACLRVGPRHARVGAREITSDCICSTNGGVASINVPAQLRRGVHI